MYEKFIRITAVIMVFLTIFTCFLMVNFKKIHSWSLRLADNNLSLDGPVMLTGALDSSLAADNSKDSSEAALHQISMELPRDVNEDNIQIEESYIDKTVTLTIKGLGKDYYTSYDIWGRADNIVEMSYYSRDMVGTIDITLSKVLELETSVKDGCLYLDFVDPHDLYDYVVVVDAGHGGKMPGADKQGVLEKDIDLDIVLKLKELFDKNDKNIGVYYTRTTDTNPEFAQRVGLANDSQADIFISIHNNSTASGRMSSISGTEVMYQGADKSGRSKELAESCLSHLLTNLGTESKGTVVGDDIYIIRESLVPVALVEVGFMTNKEELANLCDEYFQQRAAQAIYDAALEFLSTKTVE